ncbi:MAG: hypothetical protein M3R13_06160 [Armatimonadota bacterium]|nr:hypothetical protein [Armatimonadota bacterium]
MRRLWKRRWIRFATYFVASVLAFGIVDYWTYPFLSLSPTQKLSKGTDGIWIRYTWYFGEVDKERMRKHSSWLQDNGFKYGFFHVRSAGKSGGLIHDYMDRAAEMNAVVEEAAPRLMRIAWIYVGNEAGLGSVDLSTDETKRALVETAGRLLSEGKFEGIQWDYEICPDGDEDFLELLRLSREGLPKDTFIGVCTPTNYGWPLAGFGWSEGYFRRVAELSDQIAMMVYDTGMVLPRMYASHVGRQVDVIDRATAGTECGVLFGLPSYGPGFRSHNPRAENLQIGIRALRSALEGNVPKNFEGISIFADYTTDKEEWREYRESWK